VAHELHHKKTKNVERLQCPQRMSFCLASKKYSNSSGLLCSLCSLDRRNLANLDDKGCHSVYLHPLSRLGDPSKNPAVSKHFFLFLNVGELGHYSHPIHTVKDSHERAAERKRSPRSGELLHYHYPYRASPIHSS
jgi:hypothetical protein